MIFDTHAHYDDEQFDGDREALLSSMENGGVGAIVNVSASYESCRRVLELARAYPFMYAAVGVHPDEVGGLTEARLEEMKILCQDPKVLAVGEIGLDYYWNKESREQQIYWFERQLELARDVDLPVLIHSREAAADTMEIMKKHAGDLTGVIHCYSYSAEMAKEYVKMGYYIGVGGVVTFKNARKLKETVEAVPLSSIVLETDCPYLAPVPFRGKRNSSLYLSYVAEEIARIKQVSPKEVTAQTWQNAKDLYRL